MDVQRPSRQDAARPTPSSSSSSASSSSGPAAAAAPGGPRAPRAAHAFATLLERARAAGGGGPAGALRTGRPLGAGATGEPGGDGIGARAGIGRSSKGARAGDGDGAHDAAARDALGRAREQAARDGDGDGETGPRRRGSRGVATEADLLDPATRYAAQLAPPQAGLLGVAPRDSATTEPALRGRSLEELLPALVKRIAWAGDRHRGTVRLELGAGSFAGATLLVHAEGSRVRVEVGGVGGAELDRLRARIDARLRGHGLDVESVT